MTLGLKAISWSALRPFSGSSTIRLFSITVPSAVVSVLQQRCSSGHLDLLGNVTNLHREVDASDCANFEFNAAAYAPFKAGILCAHFVESGQKRRDGVNASFIRGRRSHLIGCGTDDRHNDTRHYRARCVGNGACDFTEILRQKRRAASAINSRPRFFDIQIPSRFASRGQAWSLCYDRGVELIPTGVRTQAVGLAADRRTGLIYCLHTQ